MFMFIFVRGGEIKLEKLNWNRLEFWNAPLPFTKGGWGGLANGMIGHRR